MLRTVTNKRRNLYAWILLALVILYYYLDNFFWGPIVGGSVGSYILRPLAWGALALFVLWLPGARPAGKRRLKRFFIGMGLACGIIAILGSMAAGVMGGFGKSPYSHSLVGIITNVFFLAAYIWGMESARAWLLNKYFRQHPVIGIVLSGLLFSVFWYPLTQVIGLASGSEVIEFVGNFFLPSIGESCLCSYLAFLGGPLPSIIYRAVFMGFQWLSPILPSSSWVIQTLIGTFVPIICITFVHQSYLAETRVHRKRFQDDNVWEGLFSSAFVIIFVWFSAGIFSIFPAVVVSGSMLPVIKVGDMIIVKKIPSTEVQLGDIIQYKKDDIRIVHRVIEINADGSKTSFITKGDNNPTPDIDPVAAEQVVGKVISTVPRAGVVTMLIHSPDKDVWNNMTNIINGDAAAHPQQKEVKNNEANP